MSRISAQSSQDPVFPLGLGGIGPHFLEIDGDCGGVQTEAAAAAEEGLLESAILLRYAGFQ